MNGRLAVATGTNPEWLRLAVAGLAILAVYLPIFPRLAAEWMEFPSLSHGFAVPLIAGYLIWTRRNVIGRMALAPAWGGFPLVLAGLGLYTVGTLGGEPFVARVSLLSTLLGTALFLAGPRITSEMVPGIGYLVFMIPLPYVTLKTLTDQSRLIDATITAAVLPWVGVPVLQEGFLLHLANITLEVADECSSIPAIVALLALGAAYGFVNRRPRPIRIVLVLAAVPLGLISNIIRIITTAAGAYYLGPIALHNVVHMWNGTTVFLMTLGALGLVDLGLRRVSRCRR